MRAIAFARAFSDAKSASIPTVMMLRGDLLD